MRIPKPWLREQNQCWYVTLDGEQHNLGRDEEKAKEQYADLLSKRKQRGVWNGEQNLRKLLDLYYGHCKKNLAQTTSDRRKWVLKSFGEFVPASMKALQLRPFHV